MLDRRDAIILGSALALVQGPDARTLERRLGDGPVGIVLDATEREVAARALDAYADRRTSLSGYASGLARELRAHR